MTKQTVLAAAMLILFGCGASAFGQKHPPVQRATIRVMSEGYKPESFRLRRGILAKVTFIRRAEGCGDVVVIPEYGVRRNLPMDQPVTVTFRPRHSGTFGFACGMDMLKGQIIVK